MINTNSRLLKTLFSSPISRFTTQKPLVNTTLRLLQPLLSCLMEVVLNKVYCIIMKFEFHRRYFRSELERMDEGLRREDLAVHVRRENVFEDSFRELHRRSADEWKNRFYIVFEGEEGQDAGGLLREW